MGRDLCDVRHCVDPDGGHCLGVADHRSGIDRRGTGGGGDSFNRIAERGLSLRYAVRDWLRRFLESAAPAPAEVDEDEFLSSEEAATMLGLSVLSVARLVAERRLTPATHRGRRGVTRSSVELDQALLLTRPGRVRASVNTIIRWF